MVARPAAATMMPACPRLAPGSRATSAITKVLMSAENAAPALTWCSARASSPVSFSGETERATKSSPMSAPATVAQPLKKSWKLTGTTGQRYLAAPALPSGRRPPAAPTALVRRTAPLLVWLPSSPRTNASKITGAVP